MSHRHRALLRDSLRIAKNSAQLMANYAAGLRFEAAASTGMVGLNSDRLWLQSTHWRRHGRWERGRIVKTPRGRGLCFPTVRVVPSGRCLWRYDFWMHQRVRRDLADCFAMPPVQVSDARWNKCLAAVVRAAPCIDMAAWCEVDHGLLARQMWNAFQVPLHLVGLSEPTAPERMGDRDGYGPSPLLQALRYASKRVDVPPFDGSIGPA